MIKKILSFVLVIVVIFAMGACAKNGNKLGCKVGIITGPKELFPETAEAVEVLSAKYGDEVVTAGLPTNYANDGGKAIESVAKALVNELKVKAIVVADAVEGTANAVDKIKELDPNIPVICCNTEEKLESFKNADAFFNPDMAAMGKLAVDQAKKAGAVNFYYYSFQRNEGFERNIALRKSVEDNCKQNGITFNYVNSVDPASSNDIALAGTFIVEDAARNEQKKKDGKPDAYLSTDPSVYASIVKSAVRFKNALVPQGHGASYSGLKTGLEIDVSGNEENRDFVIEKAKELLKDISGKASVPAVSLPTLIISTATVCAAKAVSSSKALQENSVLKAAEQFATEDKFSMNKTADTVFEFSTSAMEF